VIFPRGDPRNGHWIGAIDPALIDASAHNPGNGNIAYSSHYGGGWDHRDQVGGIYHWFPDGTSLLVGQSVPTPTRHTLDQNQARQRTAFTPSQRVPKPPAAFQAKLTHPSGATASLNASGGWVLTSAPGTSLTIMVSGGVSMTLSGTTVTVSGDVHTTGAMIAGFGGGDQVGVQTHRHLTTGGSGSTTTIPVAGT